MSDMRYPYLVIQN